MTTMPIDNYPLILRWLQFIGLSVNKLAFKSINIIQSTLLAALSVGMSLLCKNPKNIYPIYKKTTDINITSNTSSVGELLYLRSRTQGAGPKMCLCMPHSCEQLTHQIWLKFAQCCRRR